MTKLRGVVALVTGGSRGIGAASARALASAGADVTIGHWQHPKEAKSLVDELIAEGAAASAASVDVTDRKSVQRFVQGVAEKKARIDVAVNSVGFAVWRDFLDITDDEWTRQMDVNATGVFRVSQEVARLMRQQRKGKIINITSITGQRADPELVAYGASKAAAEMLTRGMAAALGPHNITVNAVLPGTTPTDMNRENLARPGVREMLESRTPLGRLGLPTDTAAVITFLASKEADYITGASFIVDGGFMA
jgi:NAD(P)-dependent dehydrogenase (short-subunit alcohol dehydrogenase family)